MSDPKDEGEAFRRARSGRNIAIMIGLLGFVVLVFIITITRLAANVPAATNGF